MPPNIAPRPPKGFSLKLWNDLFRQNEIVKLSKLLGADVQDTALEIAKWASRDSQGRELNSAEDYVRAAQDMIRAATGRGEHKG